MDSLDYGVIGNGMSAALISPVGQIDWCCLPAFDSASVFASLLDEERGGSFGIALVDQQRTEQKYVPRTNILSTILHGDGGSLEILDFMPRYHPTANSTSFPPEIVRVLRPLSGQPRVRIAYNPRLGYAENTTLHSIGDEYLKSYTESGAYESVYLYSNLNLDQVLACDEISITDDAYLLLSYNEKIDLPTIDSIHLELERTRVYWLNWVALSRTFPEFNDIIERSSLTLKMLTYQRTGAVVAALTTSLPEEIGGERNWDYRYCWLRDASMTINVFTQIGHHGVGSRFLQYILDVIPYKNEKIQIMYGIRGERNLTERMLPWLSGYKGSAPVRVGNAAHSQKQNDIFGLVLETIWQRLSARPEDFPNKEGLWTVVRALVRNIEHNWLEPDAGIWEIRGNNKHFVFSKLLCWVGVNRAIKIAQLLGRDRYIQDWAPLMNAIRAEIETHGWSDKAQAFTQSYENESLDAANLLIEPYGFLNADDPRYISTVNMTYDSLCRNGLMYRYRNQDNFGEPSSSFTVCSFWMVTALHRIGRKAEAREMFEGLIERTNHLGLLSEDMQFDSRRLLGNFPQGYSHLAMIDTAITLGEDSEH